MTVREYIGARYVPLFIGEWDNTVSYEPLSIVQYQGNSYTSRQYVPIGIEITNEAYWASTGDYNAQIEAYRQEVQAFDGRITNVEDKFDSNGKVEDNLVITDSIADSAVTTDKIADDSITTDKIEDDAITTDKIASGAVQTSDIADYAITHSKLGEGAVTSVNILDGSIGFVDLNQNVQQRILNQNVRYSNIVFIGDSYGRGVGGTEGQGWPYWCATYLNISSYINVSNSGAGFVALGHTGDLTGMDFYQQLNYAEENLPSNMTPETVDIIVIAGGYNDHAQSGLRARVKSTAYHAKSLFPNARICILPLCVGDRTLDGEYNKCFHEIICGAAEGGAATSENSIYWLYPFQIETSAGDQIHPNGEGYKVQGRNIASFIMGSDIPAFTSTLGASGEGYATSDAWSPDGFRCGVNNNVAWMSGKFYKSNASSTSGYLFTAPSYLRPNSTQYFLAFFYQDSSHHGIMRCSINPNGIVSAVTYEAGTTQSNTAYTIYIPYTAIVLGHTWM